MIVSNLYTFLVGMAIGEIISLGILIVLFDEIEEKERVLGGKVEPYTLPPIRPHKLKESFRKETK